VTFATNESGSFSNGSMSFGSGDTTPQTTTYTATTNTTANISISTSGDATIDNSPIAYTSTGGGPTNTIALSGPTSGATGVEATFTVNTYNLAAGDTITPHTSGTGTFSPTSISAATGTNVYTFMYTPTLSQPADISITDSESYTITGSPIAFVSTTNTLTMSGPTGGQLGTRSTLFEISAVLSGTDIVTPNDGGALGFFSPPVLNFPEGASVQYFTYTPTRDGLININMTDTLGAAKVGTPIVYDVISGTTRTW
jgi:hypothetical protein